MKLSVKELKKFKQNSSFIKSNNILPILGYLKFDNGTVTKNGLNAFAIQEIKCEETFLVDEKILTQFIDHAEVDEITIKIEPNKITLSDGKTKVTSPTDNSELYPVNNEPLTEPVSIGLDRLQALKIASNFILDGDELTQKGFVFMGDGCIVGTDSLIAYVEKYSSPTPKIVFRKETISAISRFDEVWFSENDSYHFFSVPGIKYGFIKPTMDFFDMSKFSIFSKSLPKMMLNKAELIRFNDICITSSPSKVVLATIGSTKNGLSMSMNDADFNIEVNSVMDADGDSGGSFKFQPTLMNRLLKSIPDDIITMHRGESRFYITGDSESTSLIMEMI